MDRHQILGASPADVAEAHQKDQALQGEFGVRPLTYWFDCGRGTAFCLFEAPDKSSVAAIHRRAHGLLPNEIIEVQPEAVRAFLGRMADPTGLGEAPLIESGLRTLMVTTVSNAARLTNQLGDEHALETLNEYHRAQQRILASLGGRLVRRLTDGLLASFVSPSRAVECAIAIVRCTRREHPEIHVKVGLDAGEPVAKNDDLFGSTVNLANAVAAHCDPDRILASQVVRDLCRGKRITFSARGEVELPGFDEPVRLFDVDWRMET
jgi:class 3 adenylate cyclase